MPTLHTVTSYKFDELSDKAKEVARDWFREGALDHGWWEFTYEDAARIGLKIRGFDLGRGTQRVDGKFEREPADVARAIVADHGKECETFKLAEAYLASEQTDEQADEFDRDLRSAYWTALNHEADYLVSEECVDDNIKANEYDFDASGDRFRY